VPSPFAYSQKSRLWTNYRINGLHTIGTSRKRIMSAPIQFLRILPIVRFASLLRQSQDPSAPPTASDSDHQIKPLDRQSTCRSSLLVKPASLAEPQGQTSHDEKADESPVCQPKSRFLRSFAAFRTLQPSSCLPCAELGPEDMADHDP
jgi:hypothetical protein